MKIKWPESAVTAARVGLYHSLVAQHTSLHHTLSLLREDEKLCEHIQPISASMNANTLSLRCVRLTFVCTTLGKTLLEAAYLRCCESTTFTDDMVLSIEMHCLTNGIRQPQIVWKIYGLTPKVISTKLDAVANSLNEILKEGI